MNTAIGEKTKVCPKCGGTMIPEPEDYGEEWDCIQCGNRKTKKEYTGQDIYRNLFDEKEREEEMVATIIDKLKEESFPPIPPKPDVAELNVFKARKALHDYYEENAMEITADYNTYGLRYVKKRWGISAAGFDNFRKRHGLSNAWDNHDRRTTGDRAPASSINLPNFPEFNENWGDKVKVAWLQSFSEIIRRTPAPVWRLADIAQDIPNSYDAVAILWKPK